MEIINKENTYRPNFGMSVIYGRGMNKSKLIEQARQRTRGYVHEQKLSKLMDRFVHSQAKNNKFNILINGIDDVRVVPKEQNMSNANEIVIKTILDPIGSAYRRIDNRYNKLIHSPLKNLYYNVLSFVDRCYVGILAENDYTALLSNKLPKARALADKL